MCIKFIHANSKFIVQISVISDIMTLINNMCGSDGLTLSAQQEGSPHMKYRLLIAGKASSIIDDFFLRMSQSFECMTTSVRTDDILRHINYFSPHLFVYCMYNESRDDFNKMIALKYQLEKSKVHFALIGSQTDCSDFERVAVNVADISLVKPLTVSDIETKLTDFLSSRHPQDVPMPTLDATPTGEIVSPNKTASPENVKSPYQAALEALYAPIPPRKHILVVDDDIRMLKVLKEHLHHDYDVATAVSGKIAMKFLEDKTTDLILLDYEMPEEKGPEVLAKIRANESTKDVPVIFLTGATEREKIAKALVQKPQGYLLKPIDRDKLLTTIAKVMES